MIIVSNIKSVDEAVLSIDQDRTVCATLNMIAEKYGHKYQLASQTGETKTMKLYLSEKYVKKLV